jgi:hypothetical protein
MTPRIINDGIATLADKNLPNKRGNPIPATARSITKTAAGGKTKPSCRNVLAKIRKELFSLLVAKLLSRASVGLQL